jgi:DNA-binding transcriptional regulator of glucitol operon
MDSTTIALLIVLVGAWLLQIFMSNWQMRRFHRRSQEMRRTGTDMAVGLAGTTYRTKTYAVLVVDLFRKVTAAGYLRGFTVFADMKELPQLEGMDLDEIGRGDPPDGVPDKTWKALDHAAGFIRKKLANSSTGSDDREAEE